MTRYQQETRDESVHLPDELVVAGKHTYSKNDHTDSQACFFFWGKLLVLVLSFAAYLPVVNCLFFADDYGNYAALKTKPLHQLLMQPCNEHIQPLLWLTYWLERMVWGNSFANYHWGTLLLHIANTALLMFFIRRTTRDDFLTWVSGLAFGTSVSLWHGVAWWSANGFALNTFWLLLVLLCSIEFWRTQRWMFYGLAVVGTIGQVASFSYGIETPFLFFLLGLTLNGGYKRLRTYRIALGGMLPLFCVFLTKLWLSGGISAPQLHALSNSSENSTFCERISAALMKVLFGFIHGFIEPMTGSSLARDIAVRYGFDGTWATGCTLVFFGIVVLVLFDWKQAGLKKRGLFILVMTLCSVLLYAIPAYGRRIFDLAEFIEKSRYRYPVGAFAIPALAAIYVSLKPFTRTNKWRWLRPPVIVWGCFTVCINIAAIHSNLDTMQNEARRTFSTVETFITDLKTFLDTHPNPKEIGVLVTYFDYGPASFCLWTNYAVQAFLEPLDQCRIQLFESPDQTWMATGKPLVQPEWRSGHLIPISEPFDFSLLMNDPSGKKWKLPEYRFELPLEKLLRVNVRFPAPRSSSKFIIQSMKLVLDGSEIIDIPENRLRIVPSDSVGHTAYGTLYESKTLSVLVVPAPLENIDLRHHQRAVLLLKAAAELGRSIDVDWVPVRGEKTVQDSRWELVRPPTPLSE